MDHPVFDHEGPWTESAYRGLPRDRRIEVVDGTLLVGPSPTERRTRAVSTVCDAIQAALPEGLRVLGPVPLRLGPDCVLVPDLLITSGEPGAAGPDGEVHDATAALMVVEVIGREHGAMDRSFKPQLYARSSIPYSVLIDHDLGFAVAHMIIAGRYHEYARAEGDQPLRLDEPFALTIDLARTAEPGVAESVVAESGWADEGPAQPEVVQPEGSGPEGAGTQWDDLGPVEPERSEPEPEPGLTAQALAESELAQREPGESEHAVSEVPGSEPVESDPGPAASTLADPESNEPEPGLEDAGLDEREPAEPEPSARVLAEPDRAARDDAARDQTAPDQTARDQAARDQAAPDRAAPDPVADQAPPEPTSVESDGQLPRREPRSRRQPRNAQTPAAS